MVYPRHKNNTASTHSRKKQIKVSATSVKHSGIKKVSCTSVKHNAATEKVSKTSVKKSVPEEVDDFFDTKSGDADIVSRESLEAVVTMKEPEKEEPEKEDPEQEEPEMEDPTAICMSQSTNQTASVSWAAESIQNIADIIGELRANFSPTICI